MTTRTFKQQGLAYGSSPVTLVAKVNGAEVFNGTVTTLNEPIPAAPVDGLVYSSDPADLFTFTDDAAFSGTKTLEISVSGGTLIVAGLLADYSSYAAPSTPVDPSKYPGAGKFGSAFANTVDGITQNNAVINVTIDDVAQAVGEEVIGTRYYNVEPGSVFKATLQISKGIDPVALGYPGA
jgi:hypothetical protein